MHKLIVATAVLIVLMAACANDTADDVTGSAEPSAGATTETSPTDAMTAGAECMDATEAEGQADLELQDFIFAPPCLEISTAQGLRIHNEGRAEHNFTVEGFGLDVDVSPGDENNTEATGLEPGTYTFFCKYHRESKDMEGKLVVKAA